MIIAFFNCLCLEGISTDYGKFWNDENLEN